MSKIKIGITIGDPSGIGPEVVVKSLDRLNAPRDCQIFVFGDEIALLKNGFKRISHKFNLIDIGFIQKSEFEFGKLSSRFGKASFLYLKKAVEFLKDGSIDCIVTAAVSKEAISLNKIKFCGHTEFLASAFKVKDFVMMFVADRLKISLITRHIALRDVCKTIDRRSIGMNISITLDALKRYFGIKNPRIAVTGLNPHASEDGLMGNEERRIISPVINQLRRKSKLIFGPLPADTVFNRALNKEFDAVICMYHDQGLIPFKMLYFNEGVNLTLGLPFIRTSCVHGTAFEIAGRNKADYRSMLSAIKLAYKLTKNRKRI
jgi:4-hydroxythreonine-4-phosphate dehydrogenase